MAKTVFGMPGVGKQPSKGDASSSGAPSSSDKGGAGTPRKDIGAGAKMAKPAMAKPVGAPMAKPLGSANAPSKPAAAEGAKTVFGMPAMKVPGKAPQSSPAPAAPAPAAQPESAYGETQAMAATSARGASVPAPAADGDDKLAFKETVLGMAAVGKEGATATTPSDAPPTAEMPATGGSPAMDMTVAAGASSSAAATGDPAEADASWTGQVADVPMESFSSGTTGTDNPIPAAMASPIAGMKRKRSGNTFKIVVGAIFVAVVLAVAALYLFGGSANPTPTMQPTLPASYNPGGSQPQVPTVPTAPTAPAGIPGAVPTPPTPPSPAGSPAQ